MYRQESAIAKQLSESYKKEIYSGLNLEVLQRFYIYLNGKKQLIQTWKGKTTVLSWLASFI